LFELFQRQEIYTKPIGHSSSHGSVILGGDFLT